VARQKILVAKLISVEVESKVKISGDDAKAYYDAHREEFMSPMRVRASHILLRSREEAESVLAKIQAGADFGEMAKQFSLDPTASKGGDLGFFEKGQLILEIEEAAFAMKKDQLSQVIQTTFGFHLLKLTDLAEPQIREYESVKREIIEKLTVNEKTKHFAELTERLKTKGKIKINEKALGDLKFDSAGPETPGSLAQPEAP
jgi:parvulin-like peptidyl-prolyl isomerase